MVNPQQQKRSPSPQKLLGIKEAAKETFEITFKQWYQDRQKAATNAIKMQNQLQAFVGKTIKDLKAKGFSIPANVVARMINKGKMVSAAKPESAQKYIDYVKKTFDDFEYGAKVKKATALQNSLRDQVKAGNRGFSPNIILMHLQDPSNLSPTQLDAYLDYLEKYSKGKTVDRTNLISETNAIRDMFADSWKEMRDVVAQAAKKQAKDPEFDNKKSVEAAQDINIDEYNHQEIEMLTFVKNLTEEDLEFLTEKERKDWYVSIRNTVETKQIDSSFEHLRRRIETNKKFREVDAILSKATGVKSLLRDRLFVAIGLMGRITLFNRSISRNPFRYLNMAIKGLEGDFEAVNKAFVRPLAQKQSAYKNQVEKAKKNLLNASEKLHKNKEKRKKQLVKLGMIALQREYLANIGNGTDAEIKNALKRGIFSVKEMIEKSREYADTGSGQQTGRFGGDSFAKKLEIYEDVFSLFTDADGNFDLDAAEASLTEAEQNAFDTGQVWSMEAANMEEVNSRRDGELFVRINNYYGHTVERSFDEELDHVLDVATKRFSTASGRTISRTAGAKPLSLDYFENIYGVYNGAALDFYMGDALSVMGTALIKAEKNTEKGTLYTAIAKGIYNGIDDINRDVFEKSLSDNSFLSSATSLIISRGYQSLLGDPVRAGMEFATNLEHALIYDPVALGSGTKIITENGIGTIKEAVKNANSTEYGRMFGKEASGKFVEAGGIAYKSATKLGKATDKTADLLISSPDKVISTPLWVGAFARSFKKQTGDDVNWGLMSSINTDANAYREKYDKAIKQASFDADELVVDVSATTNPYETAIFHKISKKDHPFKKGFKASDKFFNSFQLFESISMIKGMNGLMFGENIKRRRGGALALATVARMSTYSYLTYHVGATSVQLILGLIGADDEEEKERLAREINPTTDEGRDNAISSIVGTLITLMFRRSGAVGRNIGGYGIEKLNQKYGHKVGLRSQEEYKFGNSMMFTTVPIAKDGQKPLSAAELEIKTALAFTGQLSPFLTSMTKGFQTYTDFANKTKSLREKVAETAITIESYDELLKNGDITQKDRDDWVKEKEQEIKDIVEEKAGKINVLEKRLTSDIFRLANSTVGIPSGKFFQRFLVERYTKEYRLLDAKDSATLKKYKNLLEDYEQKISNAESIMKDDNASIEDKRNAADTKGLLKANIRSVNQMIDALKEEEYEKSLLDKESKERAETKEIKELIEKYEAILDGEKKERGK